MKSIYLFCSKPWVYLTELPIIILFTIAVNYNDASKDVFKFYPLLVFLALAIVFIAVYFFRLISISTDEIRSLGLFSSRDRAFITKDRTLVIAVRPRGILRFELYGGMGSEPVFDWMTAEDAEHREVCYFRGKSLGGKATVSKILEFFELTHEEAAAALTDGHESSHKLVNVSSEQKNEVFEVRIRFNETII